jgi:cell pole-organizing protein PopZ
MEEILASIRRIIEDSDNARRPNGDFAADDAGEEPVSVEPVADMPFVEEEPAPEVEAFRSGLSEHDEEPTPRVQPHAEAPVVEADGAAVEPVGRALNGNGHAAHHHAEPLPVQVAAAPEAHRQHDDAGPRGAILSEVAGRQVAAAFEELNEAFSASRKRSYDEIAEEIMRPMLQDWLDNNLPLLVERLVREEIERVARGGAR